MDKTIYTIGHSTHTIEDFIAELKSFEIEFLADIRSFPGSRKYPQFNKENLERSLQNSGIEYAHFQDLGGRRKPNANSKNTGWRNESFRAYADYMESGDFKKATHELEILAEKKRVAYMCSEAVWWRCHRSLVSDFLKLRGWKVLHIMGLNKSQEHPYTSPTRIVNGELLYSKADELDLN